MMLLGRYGKQITLPYSIVDSFYDGLEKNKGNTLYLDPQQIGFSVATQILNCHLPGDISILKEMQKYRVAEKAPPLRKIGATYQFFEVLAKVPDFHLSIEKCDIYETDPFSKYLRTRNFTAEKLTLDDFDMKNFVDIRYQAAVKHLR